MTEQSDSQRKDNRRANPTSECYLLREERNGTRDSDIHKRHTRVLALFEIVLNGQPTPILELMLKSQIFSGVRVVGITATLNEPYGLLAQCGWFSDDYDWYWARIEHIQAVQVCRIPQFRGGERVVMLSSEVADYVLLNPWSTYEGCWKSTLSSLGVPGCDVWPQEGVRPPWWPSSWAHVWPFEQPPKTAKRRASDTVEIEALTQELSVAPASVGPSDNGLQAGQVVATHLDHLEPWDLRPDSGVQSAVKPCGDNLAQVAKRDGTGKGGGRGAKRARHFHT
ncbi:hypothetical protein RSOL_031460, partial [Rhizoctonia solani AG-3 Rhs1AP]